MNTGQESPRSSHIVVRRQPDHTLALMRKSQNSRGSGPGCEAGSRGEHNPSRARPCSPKCTARSTTDPAACRAGSTRLAQRRYPVRRIHGKLRIDSGAASSEGCISTSPVRCSSQPRARGLRQALPGAAAAAATAADNPAPRSLRRTCSRTAPHVLKPRRKEETYTRARFVRAGVALPACGHGGPVRRSSANFFDFAIGEVGERCRLGILNRAPAYQADKRCVVGSPRRCHNSSNKRSSQWTSGLWHRYRFVEFYPGRVFTCKQNCGSRWYDASSAPPSQVTQNPIMAGRRSKAASRYRGARGNASRRAPARPSSRMRSGR